MKTLLTILFLLACTGYGKAQYNYSGALSGSISVFAIQSLTLSGGSIIPSFNSFDDYKNGVDVDDYLSVSIKSNVSWTLSVMAQNAYFTPMSAGGSTDMPAGVLWIKTNSMGNYLSVSTTSKTLKTGNKGSNNTPGNNFDIDIRYNPGFTYKGGIYTLGLIYTLTQQ